MDFCEKGVDDEKVLYSPIMADVDILLTDDKDFQTLMWKDLRY